MLTPQESDSLHLSGLKFSADMNCNDYIDSIDRSAARQFFFVVTILHIDKSTFDYALNIATTYDTELPLYI